MPLFRGTFFLTCVELSVSVFEICAELYVPFEKHAELWVSFWENIAKLLGFTDEIYVILRFWVKDMQKLFDDYFVL